ncbi:MAG: (deoxy)nucleoside triphosphate pyrophosphohydrolase [Spirochaetales bacterium]|nr:(deoxy)nucleoside triphosphate pyrophosphohydrolase [Spirochaetales bacterium]
MKKIRVAAAIIRNGNRIFATQKGYGNYKGWWEFPGGKIEEGETPEQALIREIHEELDTTIEVGELISHVQYDYPEFHMDMDCFWCTVKEGHLKLIEAEDARWLGKEDLFSVKWLPADFDVLEKIAKEL